MVYRKTIFPRKFVAVYETTYDEMAKLKRSNETWDEFLARLTGVQKRRRR